MALPFTPHTVTIKPGTETGLSLSYSSGTTVACYIEPITSATTLALLGARDNSAYRLFANLSDRSSFALKNMVTWGTRVFSIEGLEFYEAGGIFSSLDHVFATIIELRQTVV